MTNETMLKDLITKAVDGGLLPDKLDELVGYMRELLERGSWYIDGCDVLADTRKVTGELIISLDSMFFDPNFLKALFGEQHHKAKNSKHREKCWHGCGDRVYKHSCSGWWESRTGYCWQYHAQQLAIMEPTERLKYLWEAVNDNR